MEIGRLSSFASLTGDARRRRLTRSDSRWLEITVAFKIYIESKTEKDSQNDSKTVIRVLYMLEGDK